MNYDTEMMILALTMGRLIVNGSYGEAVFTTNANPDVFDNVKQILIKSMLTIAG